ncbi:hypothetical protein HDA40_006727 [Hamadaea flava]|uniref:Uncharacterized protein n=1 Tax=Hamadaea flava TaxID=1742688 RepID=A0ABV8LUA1_9ACTN|nr:hypothetical protein [Hamadaea flava]MCP2328220.1 hypothetical protein [Hamadaea flava]
MDQQEYKLVEAREQAKWVAFLATGVAIVGWIFVGRSLNAVLVGASGRGLGYVLAGWLALAILATVMAGAGFVVSWVVSAFARYERR